MSLRLDMMAGSRISVGGMVQTAPRTDAVSVLVGSVGDALIPNGGARKSPSPRQPSLLQYGTITTKLQYTKKTFATPQATAWAAWGLTPRLFITNTIIA